MMSLRKRTGRTHWERNFAMPSGNMTQSPGSSLLIPTKIFLTPGMVPAPIFLRQSLRKHWNGVAQNRELQILQFDLF